MGKFKDGIFYLINAFDAVDRLIDSDKIITIIKYSSIKQVINYNHFSYLIVDILPYDLLSTNEKLKKIINGSYTINKDGTVDVKGDVYLSRYKLKKIPFKFNEVTGNFYCNQNQLMSLKYTPKYVGGGFNCEGNQLTSLEGSPESIGGWFFCSDNSKKFTEEEIRSVSDVKGNIIT